MALHVILKGAEEQRKDIMMTGSHIGMDGPLGNFAGSFIGFRGAMIPVDDLYEWQALSSKQSASK